MDLVLSKKCCNKNKNFRLCSKHGPRFNKLIIAYQGWMGPNLATLLIREFPALSL
jgi:hypothetical protein